MIPTREKIKMALVLFCMALLVFIGLTSCTPASATPIARVEMTMASDSLRVRPVFRIPLPADTAVVTVTVGSVTKKLTVPQIAGGAEFRFAPPAQGATVSITVTVVSYNGGRPSATATMTRSYTRPFDTPPTPIIDSITVEIVVATLAAGTAFQDAIVLGTAGDTCAVEYVETPGGRFSSQMAGLRAKGTPQPWCHSYLYSDTLTATWARWNWSYTREVLGRDA